MQVTPQPPVNEVVLSVAIARQETLMGPLLSEVLGDWFAGHPVVQSAPNYQMQTEIADNGGLQPGPRIQLVDTATDPRYWLVAPDDEEVIQVQPDYLGLNWRRRDLTREYRGYLVQRQRFVELVEQVKAGLERHDAQLRPLRAEITYINVIQPNTLWQHHGETHTLVKTAAPDGEPYEILGVGYTRQIVSDDGEFRGRLHVRLQPEYEWIKAEPRLHLNITARSGNLPEQNIEAALDFLDRGHELANQSFLGLLTDEARELWGLR